MASTSYGRYVISIIITSNSMCYHTDVFGRENKTNKASTGVTTDTDVFEFSKSARRSLTHELQNTYPTRTRTPNRNRTRNILSGPFRLLAALSQAMDSRRNQTQIQRRKSFWQTACEQAQELKRRSYRVLWPRTCLAGLQRAVPAGLWLVLIA